MSTTTDRPVLRAILFADLAGYSRRMRKDERGTLDLMSDYFDIVRLNSRRYGGALVKTTGDGAVLLFDNANGAVDFGVEMHRLVTKHQTGSELPAQFRVGIHLGEVHLANGDVYGHAVNVAARLEAEADPGSCVVSQSVYSEAKRSQKHTFEPIGARALKNIAERIPLYRVVDEANATAASAADMLQVRTIGGVQLFDGTEPLPAFKQRKAQCLFGYLSLCRGHTETIDRLAALLWPAQSRTRARRVLSDNLRQIRLSLGALSDVVIQGDHQSVALDALRFETDLESIEMAVRRGRVHDLLREDAGWPERILAGLDGSSAMFDTWLKVTREGWRARITRSLELLLDTLDPEASSLRDAAEALILQEPGHEIAAHARMRHFLAVGNRAAALDEFARLEKYLVEVYGIRPDEKILATLGGARSPTSRHPLGAESKEQPRRPRRLLRIAISSFRNSLGGEDHRATAFRSELVSNLYRFRDWSVIESEPHQLDTNQQRQLEPAPDYRIGGTLQVGKVGDRMSLTLVAHADGRVVWSEDIRLDAENWIDLQQRIIGKIAATIEVYVSADRLSRLIAGAEHDVTSHDEWLRGDQAFMRWTPDGTEQARLVFRGILARDPGFAPAYASLASISNVQHIIWPGRQRDADGDREADALASRAVELDPMDARNQRVVAWAAALNGDFDRAMIHLDLAASLNPNDPVTLGSCAQGFAWFGEPERAETLVRQALTISASLPDWLWCYFASVHFFAGRLDEALKAAELSGDRIVDNAGWKAAIYSRMGRKEEAAASFVSLVECVSPIWAGDGPVSPEAVYQWFAHAYPVRHKADRRQLTDALKGAIGAS